MPGSFSSFPSATSATTKQRHHKSSSSSSSASHSPHSDSVLSLHTAVNSTKQHQQQERRQRPVSVPLTITPGVLAELDGTERRAGAIGMNFFSELSQKSSTTPTMAALLGRQPTINEDEENGPEQEEPTSMPEFGATVTATVSDFCVHVKNEVKGEIITLEDDGHQRQKQQKTTHSVGKAMRNGSECREVIAEGTHSMHLLKREVEDAVAGVVEHPRQREAEEEAELGADATALRARQAARQRGREPVVVGWRTLERAMQTTAEDSDVSPLEQFLLGSTLLSRLCSFFEMAFADTHRPPQRKFNLKITEYAVGADGVMSAAFPSFPMPVYPPLSSASLPSTIASPSDHSAAHQQFASSYQCMVRLQLLVCPQQFRLVAKLNYTGPQCPAEEDVRIFERFFAQEVVRMNNELAVFTFVTLCRLCYPPLFASFAQLMMAQMEPQHRWAWRVDLELVHIKTDDVPQPQTVGQGGQLPATGIAGANPQQQQQKITQKIVVNNSVVMGGGFGKRFMFAILLKPHESHGENWQQKTQPRQPGDRRTTQPQTNDRRLHLTYDIDRDELSAKTTQQLDQLSPPELQTIETVFMTQIGLCRQQDQTRQQQRRECCIWPCIRALLEGQHCQQQKQPPNLQQQVPLMGMQPILHGVGL